MQAVDVILDQDDDDIDENAGGAVVINMGGPGPEDGIIQQGVTFAYAKSLAFDGAASCHWLCVDECYFSLYH